MTRFLLTLLALLTGLAAQVSPAQARVFGVGETQIGEVERGASSARVAAQTAQKLYLAPKRAIPPRAPVAEKLPHLRIYIPTVQLGSDRSLD